MSRVLDLWAGMTGTVLPFAGADAPTGWLLCYGQAVSRNTYANLFAKIGTTYGTGDGSTTFNLPDLRGRVAAGKDDMGGAAAGRLTAAAGVIDGTALGTGGGSQTHTLTIAQMPRHTHYMNGDPYDPGTFTGTGAVAGSNYGTSPGGLSDYTGADAAHPNVQPTIVLNSIIKT